MDRQQHLETSFSAENKYRLLVEAVTDYAIFMLDPQGVIVSWNAGAERLKGYTEAEIVGSHFSVFYSERDRADGLPENSLSVAAQQGRIAHEGWRIRKDGSQFWAHVVLDTIRSPEGEIVGFAKVTRDLTERRAAEEALRKSEEQLRILVQGVTDYAIYLVSPEGLVTNWNAGAQKIKGYLPEEIVGRHFSCFYIPEEVAIAKPAANLALAAAVGRMEEEGWRLRKDGSRFVAHVIIDAIRDSDGILTGFAKVTRDITERIESQQALDDAREELFQARKMEAVGRLTGGVAHDFNNLLTIVLISLKMARKRLLDAPDTLRFIDNAIQGAERGATMTQRMLAFASRQPLQLEVLSLVELVQGMRELLQRSIGPETRIVTQTVSALPNVHADGHQLETLLLNLVLNARDAMPEGGDITINTRLPNPDEMAGLEQTNTPAWAILEVADVGEGMDAETLARATEPFFTTKGVGKGTGLGLSMVHGIIEQLGGKLKIHSKVGEGTRVQLWLAACQDDARPTDSTDRPASVIPTAALRILAVDDDALVLTNTCALLEEIGHQAQRAESADAALAMLREQEFDLVITDHAMPGMTGSQLAEQLRIEYPLLPVILATGYAEITDSIRERFGVLTKPFDEQGLARVVAETVAWRQSGR
ncbi:MAG: PAS domain S-box protein [Pseudomonas sp.]